MMTPQPLPRHILAVSAAFFVAASSASAAIITSNDFETDQLSSFTQRINGNNSATNLSTTNFSFTDSNAAGVGGTDGLSKNTTDTTLIYTGAGSSLNFTNGDTYTVSAMFKVTSTAINFGVGFTEASDRGFYSTAVDSTSTDHINFRWTGTVVSPNNNFQSQSMNNGSGTNVALSPFTAFTDATHWVKMSLSLTRNASVTGQFLYDISIEDLGVNGDSIPTSLASITGGTISNAALYADSDVFAGLRITGGGTVDNFTLTSVPEPSAITALLGGIGMLAGFGRRRRLA